jgi:hypothetical protein
MATSAYVHSLIHPLNIHWISFQVDTKLIADLIVQIYEGRLQGYQCLHPVSGAASPR